ncbi:hypothetical protein BO85DRAFT_453676, partial [Aspergillus piperis CBS 112811]
MAKGEGRCTTPEMKKKTGNQDNEEEAKKAKSRQEGSEKERKTKENLASQRTAM